MRYENFIRMIGSEMWGNEPRNMRCREEIYKYIDAIEEIVKEGIEKGELRKGNPRIIATKIFGLLSDNLIHKIRDEEKIDFEELKLEYERIALRYVINKG